MPTVQKGRPKDKTGNRESQVKLGGTQLHRTQGNLRDTHLHTFKISIMEKFIENICNAEYGSTELINQTTARVVNIKIQNNDGSDDIDIWLEYSQVNDLIGLCEKISTNA